MSTFEFDGQTFELDLNDEGTYRRFISIHDDFQKRAKYAISDVQNKEMQQRKLEEMLLFFERVFGIPKMEAAFGRLATPDKIISFGKALYNHVEVFGKEQKIQIKQMKKLLKEGA